MYNYICSLVSEYLNDLVHVIYDGIVYSLGYNSSEVRWCEYQYQKCSFIVEYWNTLSSLFIILVGYSGAIYSNNIGKKIYIALMLIGFASAYFHATLSYFGQVFDELSISVLMLCCNYMLYKYDKIGLMLIKVFGLIQILVQFIYPFYNRFVLFAYSMLILNKFYSGLTSKGKTIRWFAHISVALFLISITCWILDFYMCNVYNQIFNFHSLWHVFIALTAYFTIETFLMIISYNKKLPCSFKEEKEYWTDFYEH